MVIFHYDKMLLFDNQTAQGDKKVGDPTDQGIILVEWLLYLMLPGLEC